MTTIGVSIIACACSQTYKSVLQIYGLHYSKDPAILQSAPIQGHESFCRVDLYLQSSTVLTNNGMAIANDLVCDSRCLLLGFSDGSFQCYSWHGKVRHIIGFAVRGRACGVGGRISVTLERWPQAISLEQKACGYQKEHKTLSLEHTPEFCTT